MSDQRLTVYSLTPSSTWLKYGQRLKVCSQKLSYTWFMEDQRLTVRSLTPSYTVCFLTPNVPG